MKPGIVAGIGMIIGGALLAFWCHNQLEQFNGLGQFRLMADSQRSKASGYKTGRLAGVLVAGAGVAVLAISAGKKVR